MKLKRISILVIIGVILIHSNVYAKYVYNFEENILELSRDSNAPVCNVTYSTEEWTNQDVLITITADKEIEQVSGFELSEDKKTLTKVVSKNEEGSIKVRDFSGNTTDVEYNVSNIDKEPPQIIGCENAGTYTKPLVLDYSDNVEVKDINVDKYSNNLSITFHNNYYDAFYYYGIDRTKTTLTLHVEGHPKNTRKYRYYINNKLYATTTDTVYTFTGLNKGTTYSWKVEAIDAYGNVLGKVDGSNSTSYYESITSTKNSQKFTATFHNLDSSVSKIRYAVWNYYDESNMKWYDATISQNNATITGLPFNTDYYASYVIHAYLYDANGQVLDVIGFSIDFNGSYVENNSTIDPYKLTQSGNYQIIVSDLAGNEVIYEITVK